MISSARIPIVCILGSAMLGACASNPEVLLEEFTPVDSNDLLTVDCLVPGRVRQLGQGRIYQEPHRPIKTAASTCAIRGGDFVRYDRADFRTSLSVWLESAKSGDPEAQTYVGEIFEKGMGVPSDYREAARWYAMAAEQGYDRARINLGYLYETGLGVDKDVTRALNLYRDAAGLSEGNLEYVANVDLAARKAQETALVRTTEQLAQAEKRLLEVERDYQAQQAILQRTEESLRELQQATDQQRIDVARQRQAAAADQSLRDALMNVEKLTDELAKARDDEHALQAKLARQQKEAVELQVTLDRLNSDQRTNDSRDATVAEEQRRLVLALQTAERQRREVQETLAEQRNQVLALEQRYQAQSTLHRAEIEKLQQSFGASAAAAERRLAELEDALASREHVINELNDKLALTGEALLKATVVDDMPKADADGSVSYDGLRIELINLKTEILRDGAMIALLPDRTHRQVIGQVRPSRSLVRLDINDDASTWDEDGVFNYTRDESDHLNIVAHDTANQKFRRSFRLREPFRTAAFDPVRTDGDDGQVDNLAETLSRIDFGSYHALIVGNSDYRHFSKVASAASDARRVDLVLRSRFGFKNTLLLDAAKTDLLAALSGFQKSLGGDDNFLLFYSGHCKPASAQAPAYWLLKDADPKNSKSWLSLPSLVAMIDSLPARHVLVIVDACSPGTLTSTAVPVPAPDEVIDQRLAWYRKMVDARVRSVLASDVVRPWSDSQQVAGASPFTVALLDALETKEAVIEASQLYTAIRQASVQRFRQLLSGADVRYAPIRHAGHEAGEFLFAHRDVQ